MLIRTLSALAALAIGLTVAGCNTVAGVGKDIERAGEVVQGAARK